MADNCLESPDRDLGRKQLYQSCPHFRAVHTPGVSYGIHIVFILIEGSVDDFYLYLIRS